MGSLANTRKTAIDLLGAGPMRPAQSYGAPGCALKRLFLQE
jgi:hypothetical protein